MSEVVNDKIKSGDVVYVTATNEELAGIKMTNKKINYNLRKYESTVSEILVKGGFRDERNGEVIIHPGCVLNGTFVLPMCWIDLVSNKNKEVKKTEPEDKKVEKEIKAENVEKQETIEETTEEISEEENDEMGIKFISVEKNEQEDNQDND